MAVRINDTAPDFTASTTEGEINFHEWIGDGWAMMFSHPKDFTPVCATELGNVAQMNSAFASRGCKVIGLSVDHVEDHQRWAADIEDISGTKLNFPLIADDDLSVAKLYDMLPADGGGDLRRQDRRGQPDGTYRIPHRSRQEGQDDYGLPDEHGAQFRRTAPRYRFLPTNGNAQGGDARELETG